MVTSTRYADSMNTAAQPPLDIVIFGGAGDLSWRKLLPALYMAHLHGRLATDCRIIGVGRNPWSREQYVAFIDQTSRAYVETHAMQAEAWQSFLQRLDFVSLDATAPEGYAELAAHCQPGSIKVFYLATAPSRPAAIAEGGEQRRGLRGVRLDVVGAAGGRLHGELRR